MADFDLRNPLGGKDLVGSEATCRNGVQDGIYNVSTLTLTVISINSSIGDWQHLLFSILQ
jgi:hypothetical protein